MKSVSLALAAGVSILALASAAQAADLVVEPPATIQYADPATSWDGAYVGVFGGYGWATPEFPAALPDDFEPAGWLLGVNAGVNFTLGNGIVAGVVGDLAWADINDITFFGPSSVETSIDWQGSVRGRVGFDGGAFLPYLTAGLAFAHQNLAITGPIAPFSVSDDQTHVGWTVGAGVEFAVADNLSVDLLYRYNDYGTATYTGLGADIDVGLTSHQVTAGLNLGF